MVKKFRIVLIIVIIALLISITSFATSENDITNSINIEDEVVEDTEVLLDDTNEDTIWDDSYYDTMNEDYYEDDLYMANNNIDVEKDVNGNVYEDSEEGILQGLYDFHDNKLSLLDVDYEEYGLEMLKAGTDLSSFTIDEILALDAKQIDFKDVKSIVNQVNTASIDDVLEMYNKD